MSPPGSRESFSRLWKNDFDTLEFRCSSRVAQQENTPATPMLLADFSRILLVNPCLAVPWFPTLRSTVLVEVDAVPHTARVPSQEFVVPHLTPGGKLLKPLGVTESADHVVLRNLSNAGFEFFNSGKAAGQ